MICILIKKASKFFDARKIEFCGFAMFPNNFFKVIFAGPKSERSQLQTEKMWILQSDFNEPLGSYSVFQYSTPFPCCLCSGRKDLR